MKLEAVTVCVGYADFLAESVKLNAGLLDRWIIVTTDDDEETREVCRRHSLQTILSNDHKRGGSGGGTFNKGRLIERGLQHLSANGWRMHLDADIVLPHRTRHLLEAAHLDERKIYGCDRIMIKSWEKWQTFKHSGWLAHDFHCRVEPPLGYKIGSRWVHHDVAYCPIGFFQLWHSEADQYRGARCRPYPQHHNDACRSDVQFALLWDRRDRELLPEMLVVHLESEPAKLGANWCGRTTRRFGPPHCHRPPPLCYGQH